MMNCCGFYAGRTHRRCRPLTNGRHHQALIIPRVPFGKFTFIPGQNDSEKCLSLPHYYSDNRVALYTVGHPLSHDILLSIFDMFHRPLG